MPGMSSGSGGGGASDKSKGSVFGSFAELGKFLGLIFPYVTSCKAGTDLT